MNIIIWQWDLQFELECVLFFVSRGVKFLCILQVQPLLDKCHALYRRLYTPAQVLSIDESMIKFKGRVFFRQYLPSKPTKWGLKQFVLCDATNGYCLWVITYTGKLWLKNLKIKRVTKYMYWKRWFYGFGLFALCRISINYGRNQVSIISYQYKGLAILNDKLRCILPLQGKRHLRGWRVYHSPHRWSLTCSRTTSTKATSCMLTISSARLHCSASWQSRVQEQQELSTPTGKTPQFCLQYIHDSLNPSSKISNTRQVDW